MFSQTNSLILTYIDGTRHKFGSFRLWGSLGWALTAIAAGPVIDQLGSGRISIVFSIMLFVAAIFIFTLPGVQKTTGSATVTLKGLSQLFLNSYFVWFIVLGILVSIPNTANNTFMSLYILELGGTTQTVGLAIFFSSVFEVIIFLVLDRFLKRKIHVLVGCLAVVSLLFALRWLLMAEASSPVHVALIQLLHCVTFGGYFYVGVQLTMLFVPKPYRASGQAIYTLSWSGISGVVGGLAGGWMFQNFGAQTMYRTGMMLAIIGVIGFGWMWYNLHKHGYQPRQPMNCRTTRRRNTPPSDPHTCTFISRLALGTGCILLYMTRLEDAAQRNLRVLLVKGAVVTVLHHSALRCLSFRELERALQRDDPVKYWTPRLRIFRIDIEVAMTEELEFILRLGILHIRLHEPVHDLKRIRVNIVKEGFLRSSFRALLRFTDGLLRQFRLGFSLLVLEQRLIQAEFGRHGLARFDPMDRPLDFTAGKAGAALRLRIIGAVYFDDLPVLVLDDIVALDEVSMLQTDLVAREQTEILARRILHEVLLFDVYFTGERNLAGAHFRIFRVVLRLQPFHLTFRVIGDHDLERIQHRHRPRRLQLQILPDEVLQHLTVHRAVSLGDPGLIDEARIASGV